MAATRFIRYASLLVCFSTAPFVAADTLQDIYQLALKNDPTLRSAQATYKADLQNENLAKAGLLPQISASASYTDSSTDVKNQQEFLFGSTPFTNNSAGENETERQSLNITLDQNLFNLSSWFTFKGGQQQTVLAEAQFASAQQELIVRVAQAYLEVLRATDNLRASRAQEKATARQLEQTEERFDVGLIAITDVHEARAGNDLALAQRLADEGSLGIAKEGLALLTGQQHDNLWLLSEGYAIENPTPADVSEWTTFARENNLDLKATQATVQLAKTLAQSKKAAHLPTLSARVAYEDTETDSVESRTSPQRIDLPSFSESQGLSVTFNLNAPIYAGGANIAQRKKAYAEYHAALEKNSGTMRTVLQNTRSLHLQVRTDVARSNARKQAMVSSRSALEATQAGYDVGTRNIVDVLTAQQNLFGSMRDYANTRYDYILNSLRLKQLAGTLSPQDIADLNGGLIQPTNTASEQTAE